VHRNLSERRSVGRRSEKGRKRTLIEGGIAQRKIAVGIVLPVKGGKKKGTVHAGGGADRVNQERGDSEKNGLAVLLLKRRTPSLEGKKQAPGGGGTLRTKRKGVNGVEESSVLAAQGLFNRKKGSGS